VVTVFAHQFQDSGHIITVKFSQGKYMRLNHSQNGIQSPRKIFEEMGNFRQNRPNGEYISGQFADRFHAFRVPGFPFVY